MAFNGLMSDIFLIDLSNWFLFGLCLSIAIRLFMSGCLFLLFFLIGSFVLLPLDLFGIGFNLLLVLDVRSQLHKLLTPQ